jgi:hypothetical protein
MATSAIAAIVDLLIMTDLPVAKQSKARAYVAQPAGDERCTDYFNRKSIKRIVSSRKREMPLAKSANHDGRMRFRNTSERIANGSRSGNRRAPLSELLKSFHFSSDRVRRARS